MEDSLVKQIVLGEDSAWELKSVVVPGKRVTEPDSRDLADEFAAVANSNGATFLLGVNDKTRVIEGIAIDKLDAVETWVRDICNDAIKPPIMAEIRKIPLKDANGEEKVVIRVNVPQSLFVHKSPHGYWYRIGSSKREMTPDYLARLFQQRSQTRLVCFDEQLVPTAEVSVLKKILYERFKTSLSPADDDDFLRKLHFIVPDSEGVWRPTVSGVLMACEHPEEFLPSAFIQAVCYRGTERNADYQLDARDIMGPLDFQIAEACHFVRRNMRIAAIKNPARVDIPQFAMSAVFEAIANAVAHRDYSISGAKIRLHMFSDRLEIFSPGGLPNSLVLEEMGERQFARNELLCTCLSRCPLPQNLPEVTRSTIMDRRGEGVPVIVTQTEQLCGVKPSYRLFGNSELLLTISSVPVDDSVALHKLVPNRAGGVNVSDGGVSGGVKDSGWGVNGGVKDEISLYDLICQHPGCRVPFFAKLMARTEKAIEHEIDILKSSIPAKIEFRGAPKTGGYYPIDIYG